MNYLIQHPEPIGIERDLLTAGDVIDVAKAVEGAGWDGLAFTEHPAPGYRWLAEGGGHQTLDPFVALGAGAAAPLDPDLAGRQRQDHPSSRGHPRPGVDADDRSARDGVDHSHGALLRPRRHRRRHP